MKKFLPLGICLLLLITLLPACTGGAPLAVTVTPGVEVLPTIPAITLPPTQTPLPTAAPPTVTPTLPPSPTPTVTTTPIPIEARTPATVNVQNLRMRSGPGELFSAYNWLQKGDQVTILGKARGDDWVYADTGKVQGWIYAAYTSLTNTQIASIPILLVENVVVVQGKVEEADGQPLAGIGFAVFQGKEKSKPPETLVHSLPDGRFYAYLPPGSSGLWRISLREVPCDSPVVDQNCRYTGAFAPRFTDVTLPTNQVAEFLYFPQ